MKKRSMTRRKVTGPASLTRIVEVYVRRGRPRAEEEKEWFAGMLSFEQALKMAARSQTVDGKRHSHQRRITRVALADAERCLLAAEHRIRSCSDFDQLHALIDELVRPIHGIGRLYVYDVATRIGHALGLAPERVYLHAGTRAGAKGLGIGRGRKTVEMSEVPEPLRRLRPAEIEDVLCIFKDDLVGLAPASPGRCLPRHRSRRGVC